MKKLLLATALGTVLAAAGATATHARQDAADKAPAPLATAGPTVKPVGKPDLGAGGEDAGPAINAIGNLNAGIAPFERLTAIDLKSLRFVAIDEGGRRNNPEIGVAPDDKTLWALRDQLAADPAVMATFTAAGVRFEDVVAIDIAKDGWVTVYHAAH